MIPKWSHNYPKIIPKWSQNDPKMIPTWSQNDPKMIPKWSQNNPKMVPKLSQNNPSMILKWSQTDPKTIPTWSQSDPHIIPNWSQHNPKMSPGDRAQKVIPGGAKTNESFWKSQKNVKKTIVCFPSFLLTTALVIKGQKLSPEAQTKTRASESLKITSKNKFYVSQGLP